MKIFNTISGLLTFREKSEFPTFPKAVDFGYTETDRFTVTRGPLSSKISIAWTDLVRYLELHGINQGSRKFREVLGGSTFVSDGYRVSIKSIETPA